MVVLRTRMREMRGDGGNHREKLQLIRVLSVIQYTIPGMAGTFADSVCSLTDTRSLQCNQSSRTPDFLYLLISSTLFSCVSPISLLLIHNSTIIAVHKVKSSLHISPCHDHQATQSEVFTECSMHPRLFVLLLYS
jgi:hypothetical protein